jgi:hypothetical protein
VLATKTQSDLAAKLDAFGRARWRGGRKRGKTMVEILVRQAVVTMLWRLGGRGCAARMADEFGDHPETAAARMGWALATIRTAYPAASSTAAADLRSLAFAD